MEGGGNDTATMIDRNIHGWYYQSVQKCFFICKTCYYHVIYLINIVFPWYVLKKAAPWYFWCFVSVIVCNISVTQSSVCMICWCAYAGKVMGMLPTALSLCLQPEFCRLVKFRKTVCLRCLYYFKRDTWAARFCSFYMFVGDLKEYLCFQII